MSSLEPENPGAESEPSSKPDFSVQENKLRKLANDRLYKLLKDPKADVPAGQLMAFVSKVGFRLETEKNDQPKIQNQNIFAILPGLPPDRQEQILNGFEREIKKARKELPRGG